MTRLICLRASYLRKQIWRPNAIFAKERHIWIWHAKTKYDMGGIKVLLTNLESSFLSHRNWLVSHQLLQTDRPGQCHICFGHTDSFSANEPLKYDTSYLHVIFQIWRTPHGHTNKAKGKPIISRYPNMLSAFITGTAVNCLNVINRICTIQRFYISTVMFRQVTREIEKMRDGYENQGQF